MAVAGSLTYSTKLDDSGFNKGLSALGKASGTIFKGISASVAITETVISGLVATSVKAYGEFEQLEGGIKKLFGEESAKIVMDYANKAFSSAGISANQYMETVTGISANLIKSLGGDTKKSAEMANMAIKDMADNANTFGTSMEDVQNVYSALARGMYVTLDNLKLGYAGTKAGAEQMIADANRIKEANGEMANLSVENYADLVEAIHIAQEQLNITGTTAYEAGRTIQGSLKMAKSAWLDLVAGLSNKDADLSVLIDNLVESIATFGENVIPVVEQALIGIGELVERLLPVIVDRIPNILNGVLPKLLDSGVKMVETLFNGINQNLPLIIQSALNIITTLLNTFLSMLPQILQMGITIIVELARGIIQQLPTLIPIMIDTVKLLVKTLTDNIELIIRTGIELIIALIDGLAEALPQLIPIIIDAVFLIVETIIDNLDLIIDAGIKIIFAVIEGLIDALPRLLDKIPVIIDKLVDAIINNLPKIIEMGILLIVKLIEGIIKSLPKLLNSAGQIIESLIEGIGRAIWMVIEMGGKLIGSIIDGIKQGISGVVEVGSNIISGVWQGIQNGWNWLWNKVTGFFQGLIDGVCDFLGIHSPSKVFSDEVGKWIPRGVAVGIDANTDSALDSIDKMNDEIIDKMSEASAFEMGKMAYSGTGGSVNEILSGNSVIRVENFNTLELDGEKVYENQQTIERNKNLQYAFGGAK